MATYYVDGAVGNDGNAGTSEGSGNAWATLAKAASSIAAGDTVYVKASATYTLTSTVTWAIQGTSSAPIAIIGYSSTPGDSPSGSSRPLVTTATNSTILFTLNNADFYTFANFRMTNTAGTRADGFANVTNTSESVKIENVSIDGCDWGIDAGASGTASFALSLKNSEIKNSVSGGVRIRALPASLFGNWIHDNTGPGVHHLANTVSVSLFFNRIVDNTGNGFETIAGSSAVLTLTAINNTIANNGGDGIDLVSTTGVNILTIVGNVFYGNTGVDIDQNDTQAETDNTAIVVDYNAYESGGFDGITAGPHSVVLSADPFVNAAGDDYRLNATAGGGAACRLAGVGGFDLGALQSVPGGFVIGG